MPIPAETSGRDITSSLKAILSHQGDLIQFRGYASIGLNHIPEEKRSDLQLSGCHLVDCPHHGRKEVADKMIIVDAMHFALQHPTGATLCFITGRGCRLRLSSCYSSASAVENYCNIKRYNAVHAPRELRYEDEMGNRYP